MISPTDWLFCAASAPPFAPTTRKTLLLKVLHEEYVRHNLQKHCDYASVQIVHVLQYRIWIHAKGSSIEV